MPVSRHSVQEPEELSVYADAAQGEEGRELLRIPADKKRNRGYAPLQQQEGESDDEQQCDDGSGRRGGGAAAGTAPPLHWSTKLAYALPKLATSLFSQHINGTTRKFYTDGPPKLSPATLAMLVTTLKCTDLVVGMAVGYFSDKHQSRWGRRKPFIAAGFPTWCVVVVMLCAVPDTGLSTTGYAMYFGACTPIRRSFHATRRADCE